MMNRLVKDVEVNVQQIQTTNIAPSCKLSPKVLDSRASSAFLGTEEALNLKPLNLRFGYRNKIEVPAEKRDEL